MPMNLANHIVLVTGASSGIGQACAEQAASLGATVIIAARRLDRLQEIAKHIQQSTGSVVHCCQMDVTDQQSIAAGLQSLPNEVRENITVLVNNAGLAVGSEPLQLGKPDDWNKMIDTNIKGLLLVTHAILPSMIARNKGHIINIGSIAGIQVYPKGTVYCATKHAVRAISEGLKMDVLGTNIRVTDIEPGMVETEFSVVRSRGNQQAADQLYANMTPLSPTDVADTVMFAATRPEHVNISSLLIMPTDQASVYHVHRHESQ